MSYQVKWVEENLGITRKALRGYEEKGLMPKNRDGRYRSYNDNEIRRLWTIRSLQAMGFSLKEIATFISDDTQDWKSILKKKIQELENQVQEIKDCIAYAKAVRLYEVFPEIPAEMGSIRFDEFYEKILTEWNKRSDEQDARSSQEQ